MNLRSVFGLAPSAPRGKDSELKAAIRGAIEGVIGDGGGQLAQFSTIIEAGLNIMTEEDCKNLSIAIIGLADQLKPLVK